jgi:uncharacterized protein involved in cysteine biosynthesis
VRHLRNIAIILILALGVAFVPGGGNAADTILTALSMGFLVGIAYLVYTLARQNSLTLLSLSDGRRAILYAGVGLIALLLAGTEEFFDSGAGTLAWIVLLGIAIMAIWRIWLEANSY